MLFKKDAFSLSNRPTAIVDYIISIAQEVKTISDSLRNPAAHSSSMKCNRAELCGNYILKVQKLLIHFLDKICPEEIHKNAICKENIDSRDVVSP